EPRFRMLETIREFGLERLEAGGEAAAVHDRHLDWCITLGEQSAQQVGSPGGPALVDRLESELDNLRAALHWCEQPSVDPEPGLRLAGSLMSFWSFRALVREGRSWLTRMLARSSAHTPGRARAADAAGYLALRQNDHAQAISWFDEALAFH